MTVDNCQADSDDIRILFTGSRNNRDISKVYKLVRNLGCKYGRMKLILVHGAAVGTDSLVSDAALFYGIREESHPAARFANPKERNLHMVGLGAKECHTFADKWASGTGHCARAARRAGILVIDHGVFTGYPRPVGE